MNNALAVLLLALAACGGGSSPGQPDSAPPAPVTVTSITPADGATKVSPYTTVTIALSGAADAASITSASVKVTYGDSKLPVIGALSYDGTAHTITFTPSAPLRSMGGFIITPTAIAVDVVGVTAGGTAVAEARAHFRTLANPEKHFVFQNATKVLEVADMTYGADGLVTVESIHSAGADGKLGTADDGVGALRTYTNTQGHRTVLHVSDPGPDGKWMTADDVIDDRVEITLSAAGFWSQFVDYQDPGPDGKWMTADDLVSGYTTWTFDDHDRPLIALDGDAGADNVIGNADDNVFDYTANTYEGDNIAAARSISYGDPGADGKWMTSDDGISSWTDSTIDARGLSTKYADMLPGADGKMGTADDQVQQMVFQTFDSHGDLVQSETSVGPGADGTYGTSDDLNGSTFVWTYDQTGGALTGKAIEPGTDQKFGTADDYTSNDITYDASL
jgi:hypothetical protein